MDVLAKRVDGGGEVFFSAHAPRRRSESEMAGISRRVGIAPSEG